MWLFVVLFLLCGVWWCSVICVYGFTRNRLGLTLTLKVMLTREKQVRLTLTRNPVSLHTVARAITVVEWIVECTVKYSLFTPPGFTTAPPSIVIESGRWLFVWSRVVLFSSCGIWCCSWL